MLGSASHGGGASSGGWSPGQRLPRWWWIPLVLVAAGALSAVSPWTTLCVLAFALTLLLVLQRPLLGLLLFVALQPFVDRLFEIPMGRGLPDLSIGRLTLAFLLISIVGRATIGKTRLAPLGVMELLVVAVPLGIMISAPLSDRPLDVVQSAFSFYLLPLLMYFIAKNCVHSAKELDSLFTAVMILGLLTTAYMVFELSTGIVLFSEEYVDPTRVSRVYATSYPSLWQIRGVFASSASFGRVLVTTTLASVHLFYRERGGWRRWWLLAAVVFQCLGLFLSLNRTSWVAFLFGMVVLQFGYPRLRRWLAGGTVLALVLLGAFHRPVADSVLVQGRVLYNLKTLNGRLPRWQTSFEMWKAKPLFGWGFGKFEEHSGRFRRDGQSENFGGPESDYFLILVAAGLVGFVPHVLSLSMPWFFSLCLFFRARAPDWRGFVNAEAIVVYWAILCGLLLNSLTVVQTQSVVRGLVFTVAGAVVGTHERWLRAGERARHAVDGDGLCDPISGQGRIARLGMADR